MKLFIFFAFLTVVFVAIGLSDRSTSPSAKSQAAEVVEDGLHNAAFSVPASSVSGFYPRLICQRAVADRLGYPEMGRFPGPQSPDYVAKATETDIGWYVVSYVDYWDDDSAGMKRASYLCNVALDGTVSVKF